MHLQGLGQAAAVLRKAQGARDTKPVSSKTLRRLSHIDVAFNATRHATAIGCNQWYAEILAEVAALSSSSEKEKPDVGNCVKYEAFVHMPQEASNVAPVPVTQDGDARLPNEQPAEAPVPLVEMQVEGVVEDQPPSPVPTEDADADVEEKPKNDRLEKVKLEKEKLENEKLRDRAKHEIDQLVDPYFQQVASMRSLMERLPRVERLEKEDEVNELEAHLRTFAKRAFSDVTQCLGLCDRSSDHLRQHISMKLAGINKRGMPLQHSKSKFRKKKGL
mmetsp:Transcript_78496/g.243796  ORF Transcript_78496/g.243796 Transcript_78496/m.243796 type:complete len:275 (+) Transcript_78496:107-931(+)